MATLTERESEAAKAGAKAGAKARRREAAEGSAQIEAVLAAESGDREAATWTHSYRAGTDDEGGPDRRAATIREDGRAHLTGEELLAATWHAAKLAAGQLAGRHSIPPLSPDEVAELRDELVTRLLTEANPQGPAAPGRGKARRDRWGHLVRPHTDAANLPQRDRLTRSYLVQRARGIVLDDPQRAHTDANLEAGGVTPEQLADGAESRARSRKAAHDPMLNEGPDIDGTWPEVAAAGEIVAAPAKARRAAAYLTGGGRAEGWAMVWGVTPGKARTRHIPEGAAWHRAGRNGRRFAAAVRMAAIIDRDDLDAREEFRAAIEKGLTDAPARTRATIEPRDRTQPDAPAPVVIRKARPDADADELAERLDAPVTIRSRRRTLAPARSDRARTKAARVAGWTTPRT